MGTQIVVLKEGLALAMVIYTYTYTKNGRSGAVIALYNECILGKRIDKLSGLCTISNSCWHVLLKDTYVLVVEFCIVYAKVRGQQKPALCCFLASASYAHLHMKLSSVFI